MAFQGVRANIPNSDKNVDTTQTSTDSGVWSTIGEVAGDVVEAGGDAVKSAIPEWIDAGGGSTNGRPSAYKPQTSGEVFPERSVARGETARRRRDATTGGNAAAGVSPAVMIGGAVAVLGIVLAVTR